MESSVLIAVISAIISVLAMFITLWQGILAKKMYDLEKERRMEEQPDFRVYSLDSKAVIKKDGFVYLGYYIGISNLSNKDMTIKEIKLRIIGEEQMVVLQPKKTEGYMYIFDNIPCNQSLHKWVEFELTKELYLELKILKFLIEFEDIYGNKQESTIIYMNEEVYDDV